MAVEPPEVYELACSVYLGLERGLGLVQHCCRVYAHPPTTRQQVCASLEYLAAALKSESDPFLLRIYCSLARRLHLGLPCQVDVSQNVAMVVRDDLGRGVAGEHLLAVDDAGDFYYLGHLAIHLGLQLGPFGASRGEPQYRLVDWVTCHASSAWNASNIVAPAGSVYSHSLGSPFFSFFHVR